MCEVQSDPASQEPQAHEVYRRAFEEGARRATQALGSKATYHIVRTVPYGGSEPPLDVVVVQPVNQRMADIY